MNEEDIGQIAQLILNRLIFIKFLQSKGIIKKDVLDYLARLREEELNYKMKQLFLRVI